MKICENCKKNIKKKERYFEVNEYYNGEIIETKYVHKNCHDDWEERMKKQLHGKTEKFLENANQMMKKLNGNQEEYIIK